MRLALSRSLLFLVAGLVMMPAPISTPAQAADPSALWNIVHGQCVPDQTAKHDPAPCAEVTLSGGGDGYAVLKDIRGAFQYLLIPTSRISGIEDPAILAPNAGNYWHDAWLARWFTEARLGHPQPRDVVILAINSPMARTQNQLHIHIDCIRADVRQALAANLDHVGTGWAPFPVPLAGQPYRAIRLPTLDGVNPFRVLADGGLNGSDMGHHSLVLVGEAFPNQADGFVLLAGQVDVVRLDFAAGEALQDHSCATAER